MESEVSDIYSQTKEFRDKQWKTLLEKNSKSFPNYYQSPTKREFISTIGRYGYKIETNTNLLNEIINQSAFSPIYIGTNEGWVDLQIQKI